MGLAPAVRPRRRSPEGVRVEALLVGAPAHIRANNRPIDRHFAPLPPRRATYSGGVPYSRLPLPDRSHRLRDDLRLWLAWLLLLLVAVGLIAAAGPALAAAAGAPPQAPPAAPRPAPATASGATSAAPSSGAPSAPPIAAPLGALFPAAPTTTAPADDVAAGLGATLTQQVRQFALESGALPGLRLEIEVGTLDPRLRLARCERIEPYLPRGARLWGRTRIGLRCAQGVTPWNVYLPLVVKVFGPGVTSAAALPAGAVLTAADVRTTEVDLADRGTPIVKPEDAIGRTLARPLAPGQSVRAADLRRRQWFAAGETVQISAIGPGFRVNAEGQSLGPGIEGQPARVRTESGRIVVGQPVAERRIEIDM